jgi:hypothetical protein
MHNKFNIPKKKFMISVPTIHTYSQEEIDIYGIDIDVVDGNPATSSYNEFTNVMWDLDQMIDAYTKGCPIKVLSKDDVSKIYEILETYLRGQVDQLQTSINVINITDDRVSEIEKFAQEMFNLNRVTISKDILKNSNNGFNLGFNMMNLSSNHPQGSTNTDELNIVTHSHMQNAMSNMNQKPVDDTPTHPSVTYINDNRPEIDITKIKRRPVYKPLN